MKDQSFSRRGFIGSSLTMLGAGSISLGSHEALADSFLGVPKDFTVQDVMDVVIRQVKGGPFANTVDTLKAGRPDQIVTGIVTTMFCTVDVIRKAIELKANFIIAHEPTFYNHLDKTNFVENDPVYQFKRDLLSKNSIAVWRCHDYIHSLNPDGVDTGVTNALAWSKYVSPESPSVFQLPAATLQSIVEHVKQKLGQTHVRVIGDLKQSYSRILLMPGAAGGEAQISMTQKFLPEILICGEISEWETAEYIRDSISSGKKRALIVLGHVVSEEPGMKWMADWIRPQLGSLMVSHVPAHDPFLWV